MKSTEQPSETPTQLDIRHKAHQAMLDWHREWKSIRRERHRKGFHKYAYNGNLY